MTEKWVEVAASQAGAVSRAQLTDLGVARGQRRSLIRQGVLRRVAPGVLVLAGSDSSWPQDLWVCLLGAGEFSFAYRRSAAVLWGLDGVEPGTVEVAVARGRNPRQSGTARLTGLGPGDVVRLGGLRVTSIARTLVDLGSVLDGPIVERSLECALRRRLVTLAAVADATEGPRSKGARVLRQVLATRPADAPATESDAETLFAQLVRASGLPDPTRQLRVVLCGRRYRLDFAWPELRLAVEIDGAATHAPGSLTSDLRRQNQVVLDGWLVLRFTWSMLVFEHDWVQATLLTAWRLRAVAVTG